MPSSAERTTLARLLLGSGAVLLLGLLLALLAWTGPGYAAPPAAPDARHRTPTVTPTPTRTGRSGDVNTQNTGGVKVDPFIGFESVPAALVAFNDLCGDTIVSPGGEAWALSDDSFYIGEPGQFVDVTLYVQRCVGDFQPWDGVGLLPAPGLRPLLPPVAVFLPTPTPEIPVASALLLPLEVIRALPTPVPFDRAPVLAPIFSPPLVPVLPTIEAPERFEQMPTTSVALRLPNGREIALASQAELGRPDVWSYRFPIDSPSGIYELILSSGGNQQSRQISVFGAPRIYATNGNGALVQKFTTPAEARITYADFQSGREVAVILYRVVESLTKDVFSPSALAELGRWSLRPGNQPIREHFSQRLVAGPGPAYGTFVLLACYLDECNQMPRIEVTSRRVIWPQMVLGTIYIEPDASVLTLPGSFQPIRFAPGASGALIELTLSDRNPAGYLLTANAGQRMRVQMDTPNVQAYVLDPSGNLLLPTGQGVAVWDFVLQQSGQHRLVVYGVEDGHMTITIPPGSAPPSQPPTATPTPAPPPATGSLHDALLEKMAAAQTPNDFPNLANALVEHLLAHLGDFDQTGIGSATIVDALGRNDVGDRLNGIVHRVWADWSRDSSNPLNDNPAGLSPFRQLVVRVIQGQIGTLTAQEQRAILSWLTRSESLSVWRENPNGVIGAINREIFP